MTTTSTAPSAPEGPRLAPKPRLTPKQRRARRNALLSWIPIGLVALVCVAFAVGALAMQNSWWVKPEVPASSDQQLDDGMSRFDTAGVDYLGREGIARLRLTDASVSATELGLPATGDRTVTPTVPVLLLVLVDDRVLDFELVQEFTLESVDDRVTALTVMPEASGRWTTAYADLQARAADWGWSETEIAALPDALAEAARTGAATYTAVLPPRSVAGVTASVELTVDLASNSVDLRYTLTR